MKKNVLAIGIAAALAGFGVTSHAAFIYGTGTPATTPDVMTATTATNAVVNPGGLGHELVVPYFSVQGGNATLISLTNSDQVNGKVLKVRFRGATNSDDILDFQLFLSPGDVWTGALSKDATTGLTALTTTDNSCTLPRNLAGGANTLPLPSAANPVTSLFRPHRLPGYVDSQNGVATAAQAALTNEGYMEVINVANVPPRNWTAVTSNVNGTATTTLTLGANALFTSIKHVNAAGAPGAGVAPCLTDPQIAALSTELYTTATTQEAKAARNGLDTPTGGIYGSWTIVNVNTAAVAWGGNDTAINLVTGDGTTGVAAYRLFPQTRISVVADAAANGNANGPGVINSNTTNPLFTFTGNAAGSLNPVITAVFADLPDLSTPAILPNTVSPQANLNTVNAALAKTSLTNDYVTGGGIAARNDWTTTFPTRHLEAGVNYGTNVAVYNEAAVAAGPGTLGRAAAGNGVVGTYFLRGNTQLVGGVLCQTLGGALPGTITTYDQSELTGNAVSLSPVNFTQPLLCGEAVVTSINAGIANPSLLNATLTRMDLQAVGASGWATLGINTSTANGTLIGLPVVGDSFLRASGASGAGASAFFSTTNPHRYTTPAPTGR